MKIYKKKIIMIKPDDFHVHLRDGKILKKIANYTGKYYNKVIVMPNLKNPINTIKKALKYKKKIVNSSKKNKFIPLMTFYITENSNIKELEIGFLKKIFFSAKLYFKNSTNLSQYGISNLSKINKILEKMEELKIPLMIHGEIYSKNIDIFSREIFFIKNVLPKIRKNFPNLKIVLEHISTKNSAKYVLNNPPNIAATVTPHHLLYNRNDIFSNGINPHLYCLPILNKRNHQKYLIKTVTSGNKYFFLGSDSAPHLISKKENFCGSPGIFNAPTSLIIYLKIFEKMKKLKNFESFCSINGSKFYNLPLNKEKIIFKKKNWIVKNNIKINKNKKISIFLGKQTLSWKITKKK
ncbi:dihydroorotase [Buchnera aphidicola]|uniref:dihydroorotase n=1 Tax=Buchnera aphidicola TaxID=9 RepID=UPI0030EBFA22